MSRSSGTSTARATSSHASRLDPSGHPRVVNRWVASPSSGRHTSAGPAAACTHSNRSLGLGNVNILGLGLDAADIDRIAAAIERYGDRFVQRIFTDREVE